MIRSTDRILTMHAGTLPRPDDLRAMVVAKEAGQPYDEAQFIKRYRPAFNVLLRDDKSFPYILLRQDHDFPRVQKHRGARRAKMGRSIRAPIRLWHHGIPSYPLAHLGCRRLCCWPEE